MYAGSDVTSISIEKTALVADKLFIGTTEDDSEPLVGGTTLSKFLARLILALTHAGTKDPKPGQHTPAGAAHTNIHVITPTGPGKLNPTIVKALDDLYKELQKKNPGQKNKKDFAGAPFNSEDNFVMLVNEEPTMELNKFKNGKQMRVDRPEWKLSEPYYKVV